VRLTASDTPEARLARLQEPAEERYLLRYIREHFSSPAKPPPPPAAAIEVDSLRLLEIAANHNITPLIYHAILDDRIGDFPCRVLDEVRRRATTAALKSMHMAAKLVEILTALERAGIRALPIKGPTLAVRNYGSVALRGSVDLDILVDPSDVTGAAHVLSKMGLSGWDVPPEMVGAHLRSACEHPFHGGDHSVYLDLHWALSPLYFPLALDFADLWARRRMVKLIGNVPALSAEDTILHLCFHGAKHQWCYLGLVCDIAAVLQSEPAIDWALLFTLAKASGTRRIVLLGLYLTREILHCKLPPDVASLVDHDKTVRVMGIRIAANLFDRSGHQNTLGGELSMCWFFLRMRERWSDRARFLLRLAQPNVRDWKGSCLPSHLVFLHTLTKPLRHLRWLWQLKRQRPVA
jgi:hypothetical protein